MHQGLLGDKGLDLEAQLRCPVFSLSQNPTTFNLGHLGVHPYQGEDSIDDPSYKWVKNLSSTPLTQAQTSLLTKGPNYAIALRHPPHLEYITAIESVCPKLSQQDLEELRANVNRVLRGFPQI